MGSYTVPCDCCKKGGFTPRECCECCIRTGVMCMSYFLAVDQQSNGTYAVSMKDGNSGQSLSRAVFLNGNNGEYTGTLKAQAGSGRWCQEPSYKVVLSDGAENNPTGKTINIELNAYNQKKSGEGQNFARTDAISPQDGTWACATCGTRKCSSDYFDVEIGLVIGEGIDRYMMLRIIKNNVSSTLKQTFVGRCPVDNAYDIYVSAIKSMEGTYIFEGEQLNISNTTVSTNTGNANIYVFGFSCNGEAAVAVSTGQCATNSARIRVYKCSINFCTPYVEQDGRITCCDKQLGQIPVEDPIRYFYTNGHFCITNRERNSYIHRVAAVGYTDNPHIQKPHFIECDGSYREFEKRFYSIMLNRTGCCSEDCMCFTKPMLAYTHVGDDGVRRLFLHDLTDDSSVHVSDSINSDYINGYASYSDGCIGAIAWTDLNGVQKMYVW